MGDYSRLIRSLRALEYHINEVHSADDVDAATCAESADAITALEAERDALKAENERLRATLLFVRDAKPIFDYAAVRDGRVDIEAPGSPYDRGKADAYRLFSKYARAALEQGEG